MCIFFNLGFFSDDEARSSMECDGLDVFGSDFDPNHVLEGDIFSNIDYNEVNNGNEVNDEGVDPTVNQEDTGAGEIVNEEGLDPTVKQEAIAAGDIDGNLAPNHTEQQLEERVIGEAIIIMKDQVVEADEHVESKDHVKE